PLSSSFSTETPPASSISAIRRQRPLFGRALGRPSSTVLMGIMAKSRKPAIPELPFSINIDHRPAILVPATIGSAHARPAPILDIQGIHGPVERACRPATRPGPPGISSMLQIEHEKPVVFHGATTVLAQKRVESSVM